MELTIILFLSITLLFSYVMEIVANRAKVPSILLLLIVGALMRFILQQANMREFDLLTIVPVVGTLGLILIVFEGGLELEYKKEKKRLILSSFLSALCSFFLTTFFIMAILYYASDSSIRAAFISAIPIGIISSAVAIPASKFLSSHKKEFIIYESVFSDIIGIILFNYATEYEEIKASMFVDIFLHLAMVIALCFAFCLGILLLLKNNKHSVKYVMILASLVLVYSVGKIFHLPTLIIALVFGLALKHVHLLGFSTIRKYIFYENFEKDLRSLEQITQEGVFVVKTFFFILLGYMIDIGKTVTFINIGIVLVFLIAIYGIRWIVLFFINKKNVGSELYLAPRGLISVVLFLAIPMEFRSPALSMEVLLLLILAGSLIIPFAFARKKEEKALSSI